MEWVTLKYRLRQLDVSLAIAIALCKMAKVAADLTEHFARGEGEAEGEASCFQHDVIGI